MASGFARIQHSIASSGFWRTVADVFLVVTQKLLGEDPEHRSFDRRHGTDTAGRIDTGDLGISDASARDTARLYLASPPKVTRWGLLNAGVDHKEFTFVDIGCGKGRVLLLASELPFKAVHGVDISADLCRVARRNLQIYRPRICRVAEVRDQDATTYEFPPGNLFIHIYHPFAVELIVDLLLQRVNPDGRRVAVAYLVYQSDVGSVKAEFARIPWVTLRREEHSVTGQYEWLFFEN